MPKHARRGDCHARIDDQVPGLVKLDRREPFADTFRPGRSPADEYRHIGAQRKPDRGQFVARQIEFPQAIERQQRGGGVRAAAAEPAAHRNAFAQFNVHAHSAAGMRTQRPRRAHAQILLRQHARQGLEHADLVIVAGAKAQLVAQVDELEYRLQEVITVRAPTYDVQEQVDLGRCQPDAPGFREHVPRVSSV